MSGYGKTTFKPVRLPYSKAFEQLMDAQAWDHLYCKVCDDDIAICGAYTPEAEFIDEVDEHLCPICDALDDEPCPRCGCVSDASSY